MICLRALLQTDELFALRLQLLLYVVSSAEVFGQLGAHCKLPLWPHLRLWLRTLLFMMLLLVVLCYCCVIAGAVDGDGGGCRDVCVKYSTQADSW